MAARIGPNLFLAEVWEFSEGTARGSSVRLVCFAEVLAVFDSAKARGMPQFSSRNFTVRFNLLQFRPFDLCCWKPGT